MFFLSKILWSLFNPFNLILILIIAGLIFNFFNFNKISKYFYFVAFLFFFVSAILPTGSYLFYFLEKDFHNSTTIPKQIDGILILSGASNPYLTKEFNQVSLNDSAERLTEAVIIIKQKPNVKIIFAGGRADIEHPQASDSYSAKKFFKNMNIDVSRIIFESKSKNTFENIINSKRIANPKKNEKWLVITSASHLKRVLNVADKINWKLIPYATDFKSSKKFNFNVKLDFFTSLSIFQGASHEWIGLVYYYFTGKSDKIF